MPLHPASYLGAQGPDLTPPLLFVGEGNFSFSRACIEAGKIPADATTATAIESLDQLPPDGQANVQWLLEQGVKVRLNQDAAQLSPEQVRSPVASIIFMFPATGTRGATWGRTPDHIMLRRVLRAGAKVLTPTGTISITLVNSPHHAGRFDVQGAAEFAGLRHLESRPFNPNAFPGYHHITTRPEDTDAQIDQRDDTLITHIFTGAS